MRKKGIVLLTALLVASVSVAAYRVERRDLKLGSQELLEHKVFDQPKLGKQGNNLLLDDQATSASALTTVTSFSVQPDVCRTLYLTPGGTTADVPAGDVVIDGFDANGKVVRESLTLSENQATASETDRAFCSVTSVVFPVQDGGSATYDLDVGNELGLPHCLDSEHHVIKTVFNAASTTQADQSVVSSPTIVQNASSVSETKIEAEVPFNGGKDLEVFYIQNFRCLP